MRRARLLVVGIIVLALLVGAGLLIRLNPDLGMTPEAAARQAARSLEQGQVSSGPWSNRGGADAAVKRLLAPLGKLGVEHPAVVDVGDITPIDSTSSRATLHVRWITDPGAATQVPDWSYDTSLVVRKNNLTWRAEFAPTVLHPDLTDDRVFAVQTAPADRGRITAGDTTSITSVSDVVAVGIEKGRSKDPEALARTVARLTGVNADDLVKRVRAANATTFVPVITLRKSDYLDAAGALRPLPGTVFRAERRSIPLTTGFARSVLGSVAPATSQDILESKGRVSEGQLVGRSGVQRAFESTLRGTPGFAIRVVPTSLEKTASSVIDDADSSRDAFTNPDLPTPLHTVSARTGDRVSTTVDIDVQKAADAAVPSAGGPVSLAVVRDDGAVLALADAGTGATGAFDSRLGEFAGGPMSTLAAKGSTPEALGLTASALGVPYTAPVLDTGATRSNALTTAAAFALSRGGDQAGVRLAARGDTVPRHRAQQSAASALSDLPGAGEDANGQTHWVWSRFGKATVVAVTAAGDERLVRQAVKDVAQAAQD